MIEILNLLYIWCWFSGFIYFSVQFYECMYSIIRVPDGANCLRCKKKLLHVCSTSTHLKHHPPHHHHQRVNEIYSDHTWRVNEIYSDHTWRPPHQVTVLRKVSPPLRIYSKLKIQGSLPSLYLTLTNTKYGEGMVTLANAVSVLLKLCHYWRRCFLIPDKTYLQITAK